MDFPLPLSLINWIFFGILAIISAAVALGFKPAVAYLKIHVNGKILELLRKQAHTYVTALEQDPTLKGFASEEKKERAMYWLTLYAKNLGIQLDYDEASNIIEEAVYLVKNVVIPAAKRATAP